MSGLTETLELAADTYEKQMYESQLDTAPRGYLVSRGIYASAPLFRLGYVADPLPGDEQFRGRLAIPYLTPAGVVAMKYRCIEPHDCKTAGGQYHHKYAQLEGQEQHLYNVGAYHSGRDMLGIVEGEIDALTATVHLDLPTMGVPGATQWIKHGRYWSLSLRDFSLVIIFADGDKAKCTCSPRHAENCPNPKRAGLELAKAIAADAGPHRARLVQLPDGQDVNSMVVAGRVDELKRKAGL